MTEIKVEEEGDMRKSLKYSEPLKCATHKYSTISFKTQGLMLPSED
jgi:hypothetical protein